MGASPEPDPPQTHITATGNSPTQNGSGHGETRIGEALRKMVWDLGLSCFLPRDGVGKGKDRNFEHNKAWLLAESGGGAGGAGGMLTGAVEPHSVHSSFRFSLCTQVELESMAANPSAGATVLMVNLGSGGADDPGSRERRWRRVESLERSISPLTNGNALVRFSYSEIAAATRNFSKSRVFGRGALSYVFRGRVGLLRTLVAIKRLDKEDKESSKAFCRELMIASSLRHPNVVPLLGFCMDAEEGFFLVYRYVSGGNLKRHLHDRNRGLKGYTTIPWSMRYKVAIGVAEAIAYLHSGTDQCVVHRDIKPSNILLSSNKKPKLCDFGLATWTPAPSVPFLCKTVKGTFGYLAPEYFQHGKVSDKTDVYAFGVVLLELITGREPIESRRPPGEENLVIWAKTLLGKGLSGAAEELLDPHIGPSASPRTSVRLSRMIHAAGACLSSEESRRPSMSEVLSILTGKEGGIPSAASRKPRATFSGNLGAMGDYHATLQQTKSEMNNHMALAMLGVSEFGDDDLFNYH
ncbi:hypothetical protein MLD38_001214 [Melastoma candidum]|uniref:Uncharacterized protein n=1 Tax=Melastoma candidum TaxID=119954 RepID=A0ACB9SFU1_9MYRT|nr:hypothetical protein MLD38_001214 [Melastoma candidum]